MRMEKADGILAVLGRRLTLETYFKNHWIKDILQTLPANFADDRQLNGEVSTS